LQKQKIFLFLFCDKHKFDYICSTKTMNKLVFDLFR